MTSRSLGIAGVAYVLTAAFCFLLGILYALRVSPIYTSDALLIPKEQTGGSVSGLAAATKLLGISSGGEQSSNFGKFQKYWGSRDVAKQILNAHPELLRRMFSQAWDKEHNRWDNHPRTLQQIIAIPLNQLFGVYPTYVPSAQDLAETIKSTMKLDVDPLGGQIQITYHGSDAQFTQWFLNEVISQTDEAVRQAELKRDQDFVDFSMKRLQQETNVAYREALTDAVRQFEISNMYSQAGDHFSFQYAETPALPLVHSAPRPLLYTVMAFVFANLVAMSTVGAMLMWPESRFSQAAYRLFGAVSSLLKWPKGATRHGEMPRRAI